MTSLTEAERKLEDAAVAVMRATDHRGLRVRLVNPLHVGQVFETLYLVSCRLAFAPIDEQKSLATNVKLLAELLIAHLDYDQVADHQSAAL